MVRPGPRSTFHVVMAFAVTTTVALCPLAFMLTVLGPGIR